MSEVRVRVFAPAKINLTLHVTGQRDDGYHLLDSLVVFADVGDWIEVRSTQQPGLSIDGPEAGDVPRTQDNLILRVARHFAPRANLAFALTKILPVASGIGGGSADAAATFRALAALYPALTRGIATTDALLSLGADIPVCVASQSARMQGIGGHVTALPDFPSLSAVLVNPRRPVSTPAIFKALTRKTNAPMATRLPHHRDGGALIDWLKDQRNDLEAPAMALEPAIGHVLAELAELPGCHLARMSGSGASCFGLFTDGDAAAKAASRLSAEYPDWWVTPATLGDMAGRAAPQLT